MKWKITKHKVGNGQQELKVSLIISGMENSYAYDSETFITAFKEKLQEVPRKNNFAAEFAFKGKPRNQTSLEIWKMKVSGDFNYLMFTVTLQP